MTFARRLLAVATATCALSLVAVAPPSSAQTELQVEWTRPTETEPGNTLVEPGPITGRITGGADDRIQRVEFDLSPEPPLTDPEDPCLVDLAESERTRTFAPEATPPGATPPVEFDIDPGLACNGTYRLDATVSFTRPGPVVGELTRVANETTDSLTFKVAIPPSQVKGLVATFDQATREVRLEWEANLEADLLGYYVERNPRGREGFARISGDAPLRDPSFVDRDVEDEQRYRVLAVRRGATERSQIRGRPSASVTAGPDAPEPTVPNVRAAPRSPERASSGGTRPSGSSGASSRPSSPARNQDNVFEESLPFDPSRTTTIPPQELASPGDDAAVLTEVGGASDEDERRATFVPVAGGLALMVGAMHLFLLSRRVGEAEIPIVPR